MGWLKRGLVHASLWCLAAVQLYEMRNSIICSVLCSIPIILHGNGRLKDDVTIVKGNSYRHVFNVMSSLRQ